MYIIFILDKYLLVSDNRSTIMHAWNTDRYSEKWEWIVRGIEALESMGEMFTISFQLVANGV